MAREPSLGNPSTMLGAAAREPQIQGTRVGGYSCHTIQGVRAPDTYRQQAGSKEVKIADSKAARKSLFESFDKADEILKSDIDTLVEVNKTSNDYFYKQYQAARSIRDLGGHGCKTFQNIGSLRFLSFVPFIKIIRRFRRFTQIENL
jgi:hypothetical protein